jgi:uncharacterized protein YdeI (YjbR/CyaY-like superfamily)
MNDEKPIFFDDAKAFEKWLKANHARSPGIWMGIAKKDGPKTSCTYPEALEIALCWGWIDGQKGSIDATAWKQRFTPRGKRSIWSKINREKALALIAAKKMQPPGLAEVERAKADGRWEQAYDSPKNATVPDDLASALAAKKKAAELFATLDATNRYAILHRVMTAKKPETRAKRIAEFVAMLARGEVLYPDRMKKKKER